ncbi:hypothetical protein BKA63DRAFT_570981 [Paraphoma chrysanthemicola]|nr:hypothetical protein BKA63DRAFT_570981 [Paraphoma chrysanthemicola]
MDSSTQLGSPFHSPAKRESDALPSTTVLIHNVANFAMSPPPRSLEHEDSGSLQEPGYESKPVSFEVDSEYEQNIPSTWPVLFLHFHTTPGCAVPTHIDKMLVFVHYKGPGAAVLHQLLCKAIDRADVEEEKQGIELAAFAFWPFNVTADGYWKDLSGMTNEEVNMWTQMRGEG